MVIDGELVPDLNAPPSTPNNPCAATKGKRPFVHVRNASKRAVPLMKPAGVFDRETR